MKVDSIKIKVCRIVLTEDEARWLMNQLEDAAVKWHGSEPPKFKDYRFKLFSLIDNELILLKEE